MPITALDIRGAVEKEDDFGHELRVGRILRGCLAGKLLHGGTYIDPITKKPRQYDFRWYYQVNERAISLAVECKNIKGDSPVVICGRKRSSSESFHHLVEARAGGTFSTGGHRICLDGPSFGIIRTVRGNNSIYWPDAFVGKSIVKIQATRTSKSPKLTYSGGSDTEIHERWSQALASSNDLVLSACKSASVDISHMFTSVVPVVVFPEKTLWRIEYDDNGQPKADPVESDDCEFYVDREIIVPSVFESLPACRFVISHIHFFTVKGFASFLTRVTSDDDWCRSVFDEQVLKAARAERLS